MKHDPKRAMRVHFVFLIAWLVCIPVAVIFGWIYSVAFVSACSIYANLVGHWSAYQAAQADLHTPDE